MLVKEALGQALEMQPDARAEHLRQFGKASPGLLCEVQRLLAALENAGTGFMRECTLPHSASGTPPDSPTTSRDTMIGRRVGVYQIAELLGVGGMGEVYRAVRADDQYRQNIALKLIRAGQASQFVIERFKNERQILASLEHPNIARLLDGGSTEDGVPFLVMELIEGRTLTAYCNDLNLRVPDRLRLFLQVCGAVQFAHQHLVVHRDIKPGNILVGPQGTVKLLDFGVSKLVSADGFSSDSDLTLTAYRALTPNYASPEQVRGEAISTSSDVYSLGVVLYELLSGHTPYLVTAKSSHAISLAVCEFEPEKPSVVVRRPIRQDLPTGSSRDNNPSSAWLTSKQLRGDLDVIVMTSLRKEPARRYASVQEFALDIRNHLNNLPVTRRADDVVYRSVKFVRRHAVGIAATATVLIALTIGLTMAIVEKRRADRRFAEVRSLANSLLFEIHDSIRDLPGSTPARKLIADRALRYLDSLSAENGNDLSLMRELASAYERVGSVQGQYLQNSLGDTSGSLRSNQQGLALRQKISAGSKEWTDQLALAHSYRLVANQLWATGDQRGAAASNERAIAISEALQHSRPGERKVLDELVTDYSFASDIHQKTHANWVADWTLARDYMMKATTIDEAILKNDPEDIDWQRGYGVDLLQLGQILKLQLHDGPGALEQYSKALKIHQAILLKQPTPQHRRDVAVIYNHMASVNEDLFGDYKQARASNREALRLYQDAIAQDPLNAVLQQGLAIAYANLGLDEAVAGDRSSASLDLDQSIAVMKALVERSPANLQQQGYLAAMYSNRGDVRLRLHDAEGALRDYETARDVNRRIVAQSKDANVDTFLAGCELGIASAFKQKGNLEPASAAFHDSLRILQPAIQAAAPEEDALSIAADSYAGLGDIESLQAAREAYSRDPQTHRRLAQDAYRASLQIWAKIPEAHRERHGSSPAEQSPKTISVKLARIQAASPAQLASARSH